MIQNRSINHTNYRLEEREKLFEAVRLDPAIPHVLLATCNRTEVYWGMGEVPEDVALHLYRIVAGLESSLIGERAIQGQVKRAYAEASANYRLSPSLNRLFQSALHVGKRVRTETGISEGAVSHSQITVDILRQRKVDLNEKIVSIIGVNKLTEDILKYLKARGAVNIFLSNRNHEKACALASRYGGTAMSLDKKRPLLQFTDVLICATSAPHSIIHLDDFPEEKGEMLIFDLAFPRDVDGEIGQRKAVTIFNIEDIERFSQENRSLRNNEIEKAEEIIREEIIKLNKWQYRAYKTL